MTPSIIFYGAGQEAQQKFSSWLEAGVPNPVCFADADESKYYKKFTAIDPENVGLYEFDILPLDKVLERYSNYLIYVAVSHANLGSVTDYLLDVGIPKEKIRYAHPVEYKVGCPYMLTTLYLGSSDVRTCCHFNWGIAIPRMGTISETYQDYRKTYVELYKKIIANKPNPCDGCPYLKEGFWETDPQIKSIIFGTGFDGDVCNFKCSYCGYINKDKTVRYQGDSFIDVFSQAIEFFENIEDLHINIAVGEISVSPWRDEVLKVLKVKKWYSYINTNASVFISDIAEMIETGHMTIDVSLDAGTSRTYREIHGVDCFDEVVSHLTNYSNRGKSIKLKYIIIPGVNTSFEDVDGFLDLAYKLGLAVILSADVKKCHDILSMEAMEAVLRFIGKAYIINVKLYFHAICFNKLDILKISKIYPNMEIV